MKTRVVLAGLWLAQAFLPAGISAQVAAASAPDTTFLLSSDDPGRTPSPFIGNGRLGVVIPALGIGASSSFMAGLYENAPKDVPCIVMTPAWNAIDLFDGQRWLTATPPTATSVSAYRQVLDTRSGTARTSYHWVNG